MVNLIDAMAQRGVLKGDELLAVGQMRARVQDELAAAEVVQNELPAAEEVEAEEVNS